MKNTFRAAGMLRINSFIFLGMLAFSPVANAMGERPPLSPWEQVKQQSRAIDTQVAQCDPEKKLEVHVGGHTLFVRARILRNMTEYPLIPHAGMPELAPDCATVLNFSMLGLNAPYPKVTPTEDAQRWQLKGDEPAFNMALYVLDEVNSKLAPDRPVMWGNGRALYYMLMGAPGNDEFIPDINISVPPGISVLTRPKGISGEYIFKGHALGAFAIGCHSDPFRFPNGTSRTCGYVGPSGLPGVMLAFNFNYGNYGYSVKPEQIFFAIQSMFDYVQSLTIK